LFVNPHAAAWQALKDAEAKAEADRLAAFAARDKADRERAARDSIDTANANAMKAKLTEDGGRRLL
jgi:hypothetical protein